MKLKDAIDKAGGVSVVADMLGLTRGAIYDFIRRGCIPAEHCPKIEEATRGKVRCESLNDRVNWRIVRRRSA